MDGSMTGLRLRRAALALGCALAVTGGTAHAATPTVGGFQGGDGDQAATCAADARDWQCLTGSDILGAVDATGSSDDIFSSGKEETPAAWSFGTGSVPAKTDFQAVWTNVAGAPGGHSYLNLAFKRVAGNGDTYLGVELNQSRTTFRNSVGATVPCRHDGDVLVAYTAGSSPTVTLYRWDGVSGPAACPQGGDGHWVAPVTTSGALASVNTGTITNYLSTASLGTTFADQTFGEAALDLTGVADAVQYPATACEYFRSMTVKSRTSSSISSSLADFVQARNVVARSCETPDPGTGGGGGGGTPPDTTAPNAPAIAPVVNGAKSCSGRILLTGTAEPGSSVTVYEGSAAVGDFTTADPATGAWSVSVSGLALGTHTFTADATDGAGNTSSFAVPATVTVATCPSGEYGTPGVDPVQTGDGTTLPPADTTAPDAPAFAPVVDGATSCSGKVTLAGSAEPASTVTVYDGSTVAGYYLS
jgi:hypothetical protein